VAISECVKSKDVDKLEQLLNDNKELIERPEASLRTDDGDDEGRLEETNTDDTSEDPAPSEEEPPPPPPPAV